MMKLIIKEKTTLLDAVAQLAPESSKTTLRSWVKEGRVTIDGDSCKLANTEVFPAQVIEVGSRTRIIPSGIRILYEDDHLVVIDKPKDILSVATAFEKGETAHAFLKAKYGRIHVVHRLDQETSGVMLFARSDHARDELKKIFEKHAIDRIYYAVVEGRLENISGTWTSYLFEDANYVVHASQNEEKGRLAVTHYRVIGNARHYSLLEIKLETGRKNQIRVHCQEAGHSVVGDSKYGASSNPVKRLCLHAHLLGFVHPITAKKMTFTSAIPEAFLKLVKPAE